MFKKTGRAILGASISAIGAASNPLIHSARRVRSVPSLKRPRTSRDFAVIAKAQAKRDRKAAKRQRDAIRCAEGIAWQKRRIVSRAECRRISAQVKAEALAVYHELELERVA
ncbi:hypothetical protein [Paraburkholderia sediminicola]|uniref:hypothetical protein n=1 Tax=Paraburkholderia sediminicola TaxID=458836 RepID=UPI0038BE0657